MVEWSGRRLLVTVLAALLALTLSQVSYARAQSEDGVPRFEQAACKFPAPSALPAGATVRCGYLVVPEQRASGAEANGTTVRLAVAVVSSGRPRAAEPVVYLAGGPGDAGSGQRVRRCTHQRQSVAAAGVRGLRRGHGVPCQISQPARAVGSPACQTARATGDPRVHRPQHSSTTSRHAGIREGLGLADDLMKACAAWPVPAAEAMASEVVVSELPTLLLVGRFDPITPPEYALQAAMTLAHSYAVEFATGSHVNLSSGPCSIGIAREFLAAPDHPPEAKCATEGNLTFLLP